MEEYGKLIQNRGDEVQEILGTPPSWIVRWGTTVAFLSLCCLVFIGWLIRIPDTLEAEVIIKSASEPMRIKIDPEDRNFIILVEDGDTVRQGSWIAHCGDDAELSHVLLLNRTLDSLQLKSELDLLQYIPVKKLQLGELQPVYTRFLQSFEDFKTETEEALGYRDDLSLIEEIKGLKQSIELEEERLKNRKTRLRTLNNMVGKLKEDYLSKKISYEEYMKERSSIYDLENQINLIELGINDKKQLLRRLYDRQEAGRQRGEKMDKDRLGELRVSLDLLRRNIQDWKLRHIITAPVDGWVALPEGYSSGKRYVNSGKEVLSIIPFRDENEELEAEANLPPVGAGKVIPGQRVIIKLEGYPAEEFGYIEGRVSSKPVYAGNRDYLLLPLVLPEGLTTSKRKYIQYEYLMRGQGEIIVEEKRFLERLFSDFFNMVRMN
jgi:hypothetical protein